MTVMPTRRHDRAAAGVITAPVMAAIIAVTLADIAAARAGADNAALGLRGTAGTERTNGGGSSHRGSENDPLHVLPPDLHDGSGRERSSCNWRSNGNLQKYHTPLIELFDGCNLPLRRRSSKPGSGRDRDSAAEHDQKQRVHFRPPGQERRGADCQRV